MDEAVNGAHPIYEVLHLQHLCCDVIPVPLQPSTVDCLFVLSALFILYFLLSVFACLVFRSVCFCLSCLLCLPSAAGVLVPHTGMEGAHTHMLTKQMQAFLAQWLVTVCKRLCVFVCVSVCVHACV